MPTSLTDQLFEIEEVSLTDQLFSKGEGSLTDQLFTPPTTEAPVTEIPDLKISQPKKFYSTNAISPYGIVSSPMTAYMGMSGMGPQPEGGFSELGIPLNVDGQPYIETPDGVNVVGNVVAETLQGLKTLATHPMETIKGGLDFALSIPGFITGLLTATGRSAKELADQVIVGQTLDLDRIYNVAAQAMGENMEFFEPTKQSIIGQPTEESQLATQVIMAPMLALSALGHDVANYEGFADYPNIRGAAKFTGDIAGLATMGMLLHGRKGRQDFAKETEAVTQKANDIIRKEQDVKLLPDEVVRRVQEKVLEAEKRQLELEAEKISKKVSEDALIREEISRQTEEAAKAKIRPVEEAKPKLNSKKESKTERIVEVDETTGTEVAEMKGKKSPYFQDKETTSIYQKLYEERARNVAEDPELFVQKLINDVNRWYHGEEIPIAKVRESLSQLAVRADELRGDFMTGADFLVWKENVSEASTWARQLDRLEIEQTRTGDVIRRRPNFYSGLPLDEAFRLGKNAVERLKTMASLHPNSRIREWAASKADIIKSNIKTLEEGRANNWEGLTESSARGIKRNIWKANFGIRQIEKNPNVNLNQMFDNVIYGEDVITIHPTGTRLFSGDPIVDIGINKIVEGARGVAEYTKRARGLKTFKPLQSAQMLREEFNRAFIDRSGNIRNELLNKLGDEGYNVIQKMYLSKGASSVSSNMLKQMQREVYSGLSGKEKRVLDNLILAKRMVDIGQYKTSKEFKFPEEIKPINSVAYIELFSQIEKLSPERAVELSRRAESYFEWMKKPLQDMLDSGLISQAEYNALAAHNFRKIKLVDVYDKRNRTKVGKKKRTVYDSGVEALSRGRETDVFEPSSEIMALEVFNRGYGRILNNEANKALLDVAKRDNKNPFVRIKEKEGDPIPSGWSRLFVYDKGERKAIYISPEMSKEWIVSSPEMSYRLSQMLRLSSGSPVLRTFATGINWGFALANLPRDVMHLHFTARTFQDGKWKPIYNPNLPIYGLQIGVDLARVFTDAATRGKKYNDYIKEGGGMEFLVHQGRLLQRGRHLEGPTDKLYNFLGYFGETSEIMTRLAIRDRVIRRRAKEKGISIEQATKDKSITREATFAARDYMDFGQGGGIAKSADNALPYLNATIQGTRGLFRSFKPGSGSAMSSTYKLAQYAALTTGIYIAAKAMHPKSMESIQGNIDAQNNLIIPLGDEFGFVDEQGQTRYPYIKIPIDPGQKFFKTFFEASADKWLGNEIDVDRVVDSLKEQSPVGVTELPPTISGALGYVTNRDFWLNEDIWRKTDKPFRFPGSKEEFIPGYTPQAYIDFGEATGLSPERTRFAVEELTTNGTVWSYLLGEGYNAFRSLDEDQKQQHLAMTLAQTPVIKRFFGITNPYSKHATKISKAEESDTLERWIQNREMDRLVDGYLYEDSITRKEVIDYARSFKDKDIYDRLIDRFKFEQSIQDLPEKSFWKRMKGLNTEVRAKIFVDRLTESTEEERQQLWKEYGIVAQTKGIISPEFRSEVMKQLAE